MAVFDFNIYRLKYRFLEKRAHFWAVRNFQRHKLTILTYPRPAHEVYRKKKRIRIGHVPVA